jgi:hypothetical protein
LKSALRFSIIVCFIVFIGSCAKIEKGHDNFFRGMYEGLNQIQEMKSADEQPLPDKEAPPYDQYKRERQEMSSDHEGKPPQPQLTGQ